MCVVMCVVMCVCIRSILRYARVHICSNMKVGMYTLPSYPPPPPPETLTLLSLQVPKDKNVNVTSKTLSLILKHFEKVRTTYTKKVSRHLSVVVFTILFIVYILFIVIYMVKLT